MGIAKSLYAYSEAFDNPHMNMGIVQSLTVNFLSLALTNNFFC